MLGIKRWSTTYMSLLVAAYMTGLCNVWLFPALFFQYGLGSLILYAILLFVFAPVVAIPLKASFETGMGIVEYHKIEFKRATLGLLFFVTTLYLMSYYLGSSVLPIVSLITLKISENVAIDAVGWFIALIFGALLTYYIVSRGRVWAFDAMASSVVMYMILMPLLIIGGYLTLPQAQNFPLVLKQVFSWKPLGFDAFVAMTFAAIDTMAIGYGFYYVLGMIVPEEVDVLKVAIGGAIINIIASLLGAVFTALMVAIDPINSAVGDIFWVVGGLYPQLAKIGGEWLVVLYALSLFGVGYSSTIAFMEVPVRILQEAFGYDRVKATRIAVFISALAFLAISETGLLTGLMLLLMGTSSAVAVLTTFAGIVEFLPAFTNKEYIPPILRKWSKIAVPLLAFMVPMLFIGNIMDVGFTTAGFTAIGFALPRVLAKKWGV